MKTAKAVTMVFALECPHCGETTENRVDSSYDFTVGMTVDFQPGDAFECSECGKAFRIPALRMS